MTQRDVVARLRMMASEREAYTKSGRPMHVNEAMTGWLTEAADEIERLRAAGRKLLSEMWEGEYGDGYTLSARAYKEADAIFNEQPVRPMGGWPPGENPEQDR